MLLSNKASRLPVHVWASVGDCLLSGVIGPSESQILIVSVFGSMSVVYTLEEALSGLRDNTVEEIR